MSFGTTKMNLEDIELRKIIHLNEDKWHMISFICGI
jgi:hypothetical protein